MNSRKLMLLGGIRYLLPVIETAHRLGVHVVTADYLPGNIAHRHSDEYVNVSIIDKEAVLKVAREKRIDGILSFGVDPGVVTAAYVAREMGLPSPPLESVEILQNKDRFRDFLAANGFNCPWHKGYDSKHVALSDFAAAPDKFPVIVKPIDSAGSKGCTRVDAFESLPDAIDGAMAESHSGRFIIEQFLELAGHQTGSDCFSIGNELVFCSFDSQYFDADVANPYAPVAHVWPSDMPEALQKELKAELQRLIGLLQLGTSIYNVEARVAADGRPYIMEVSPRGGGNRISEVLKLATGQDLVENNVRFALGMPLLPMHEPVYDGVWVDYVIHSRKPGRLGDISTASAIHGGELVDLCVYAGKGDYVNAFNGANQALGSAFLRFASRDAAEAAIQRPDDWLSVSVGA